MSILYVVSVVLSGLYPINSILFKSSVKTPIIVAIIAAIIFGLLSISKVPELSKKTAGNIIAGKIAEGTKDSTSLTLLFQRLLNYRASRSSKRNVSTTHMHNIYAASQHEIMTVACLIGRG